MNSPLITSLENKAIPSLQAWRVELIDFRINKIWRKEAQNGGQFWVMCLFNPLNHSLAAPAPKDWVFEMPITEKSGLFNSQTFTAKMEQHLMEFLQFLKFDENEIKKFLEHAVNKNPLEQNLDYHNHRDGYQMYYVMSDDKIISGFVSLQGEVFLNGVDRSSYLNDIDFISKVAIGLEHSNKNTNRVSAQSLEALGILKPMLEKHQLEGNIEKQLPEPTNKNDEPMSNKLKI